MRKSFYLVCMAVALLLCGAATKRPVTLFMVGDSTMADKTELDISPERGWGQLLPTYLKGNIILQNHAMNGRSTKSFLDEGRWAEVMRRARKGDIVVIQFGHNDAKVSDPTRYASVEDYTANLTKMVREAQQKKLHVILCTPVARRYFKNGEFYFHHGDYPTAAKQVAHDMRVPLIDMEQLTAAWLQSIGDDASKPYYMNVPAGECTKFPEGKIDNTHYREQGALMAAQLFVQTVEQQHLPWLKRYLNYRPGATPVYSTFCRPSFNK
ncbi:MAG: rhamnogalacturonan acetylesterase [Paludibacteraceae bacterium]|nr:rhamnogalacturonan acetylesterase [Paludibacteraceae bacterium]